MANTCRWAGGAAAQAQVQSWVVAGTFLVGEQIFITIGVKTFSYTLTSATITVFLPLLKAAYNLLSASLYPEFAEMTASNTNALFILTADTPGKPFLGLVSTNSASGTIDGVAFSNGTSTTDNRGPNDWTTAANWSGGKSGTITGATNASPISIACTAHGLATGDVINIQAVLGNTAANGTWQITRTDANNFTLTLGVYSGISVGNGSYTSATGSWTAGPTNGDTFNLDNNSDNIKYGLSILAGITVVAGNVYSTFTGTIGLPKYNTDGTKYPEYRQDYLAMGITTMNIGLIPTQGQGSGRIKHNAGSVACTWNVYNSDLGAEQNLEAILLKGTSASNAISTVLGSIGFAVFGGETGNLSGGFTIGYTTSIDTDVAMRCGSGVTLATITKSGGQLVLNSAIGTSLTQTGGATVINGSGAVAQLTTGGTVVYNTTGTLGGNTVVGAPAGFIDFNAGQGAVTVTNPIVSYVAFPFQDDFKRTGAVVVDFKQVGQGLGLGTNYRITRGNVASN